MAGAPRVFIVEDHPLVREALEGRIRAAIPDVAIGYSGASIAEAKQALAEGPVDCVVLDLDLGDGSSPVHNVSQLVDAGCRVLIVSALADPATVRAGLRAGALGFVSKAAQLEDFASSLQATLEGQPSTSRDVAAILLTDESPSVHLSERERTAMVLYASGLKIESVARRMGVKPTTAQEYIRRIREKYMKAGTPLPSKTDIYRQAKEEGLVP